jgi:hypothetical protein
MKFILSSNKNREFFLLIDFSSKKLTGVISSNIKLDNSQEMFMSSEELIDHYDYMFTNDSNKLSDHSEEPCVSTIELLKLSDKLIVAKEIQVNTTLERNKI